MMRSILRRSALVLGAAFGMAFVPSSARAQKALVYCPVNVDATGCNAIVNALTGPAYPLGVDRGYDGTGGTVDLAAVDLFAYSVFVVPSLADGSASQPYAKLRDPEVAEHLKAALIGRIAMWSGSPDQGATNRGMKDALIQNLAGWAGGAFGAAKGPGLVTLLDASASVVSRYDWVRAITPVPVTSDAALLIYNGVRALNPLATTILTSGAGPIVYDNMATFGFMVPNGAAGITLDAVGQTGSAQGGQVVLLTMEAGNAGGALVQTDTDDYPPGTTVVITGSGWEPGETVKLTLHMDPLRDSDTELTAVADGSGRFTNTDYAPTQYDVYVRYVLTATGLTSGRRSQTTFTDAPRISTVSVGAQSGTATYGTPASVTFTVLPVRGGNGTVNGTFSVISGLPAGVTAGFAPATFTANGGTAFPSSTLTLTTTAAALPGSYTFTVQVADGADLATATGTLVIGAKVLNGSFTAANRVYDATTTASILTRSLSGVVGSDVVTLTGGIATFNNKNVGTGKLVTGTGFSLSGAQASRYTLASTTINTTADITKKTLAVSATGTNKVYDATASATVTTADDRILGDVFTVAFTSATFADKNVGTAKVVTVNGISLTGADAGNYDPNTTCTTAADITAKPVTGAFTADNKVYDGTTSATILTRSLTGVIAPDVVTLSGGTATFDTRHAGTGKIVTGTGFTLAGADAGNYALPATPITTTANITPRALAVTAAGASKVYDGTAAASVTLADDRISGDVFTVTYTSAVFGDKNVGAAKPITVSGISLSGVNAGDYTPNVSTAATADITPRALAISATGQNRVYDATTNATVTLGDDRVSGDVLTTAYTTAAFNDKHVGTAKPITVSGISLTGADAGNYSFSPTANATATITSRALAVSAAGVNKVYDGTSAATVTVSDDRIAGDVFTASYSTATFADKNVGTSKTVTVTGIALTGADAGDYTPNASTTTTADITARTLTITATGVNKVYDGTTAATVTLADDRVAGDLFTDTYSTATFADKNVGMAKPISVIGIAIGGADANNYMFNNTATASANITAATVIGSFTANDKVYDGNASATIDTRDLAGVLLTDVVSLTGGSAAFTDKTVGANKTVTATGVSLTGADAGNYVVQSTTLTAQADITPRTLTITATGANKVYDATTAATVTLADDRVVGDVFTDTYSSATFADKNVGTGKAISVSGIAIAGTDADNYTANTTASATANITPATVSGAITADNKVYDGTTSATILTRNLTGVLLTDVVTLNGGTATFADKSVGNGKIVTAIGFALMGGDATNYVLSPTTITTTANITALSVAGSFAADSKAYDGTTSANISSRSLAGTIGGDDVSLIGGTATFADKNVGTAKTVSGVGFTLGGGDALNYLLASGNLTTTADITPRAVAVTADPQTKVYGTADPALTYQVTTGTVVAGDPFTGALSRAPGETVLGGPYAILQNTLTLGANYTISYTAANLSITPATVVGQFTANDKVYDGNASAVIATRTIASGTVGSDDVALTGGTATFDTKDAGTGKTVTGTSFTLGGTTANNYALASTTLTTQANVTPRPLTITATGVTKVYDATATATVSLADDRVSGDLLTTALGAANFNNKNVGTAKPISVTGITVGGADAPNYTANTTASATADITAFTLTGSFTASDKVYDGTTAATIATRTVAVAFADDAVSLDGGTATFVNKNVGTGKGVNGTGFTLGGANAANYVLASTELATTADITPTALTISATGINRVYDGTTNATVTLADDRVAGDAFTDTYTAAAFNNPNVGNAKPVSVTGIAIAGADAANYTFNTTASTTADITQRSLTVTAANKTKIAGEPNPPLTGSLVGVQVGDNITASYTTTATIGSTPAMYPITPVLADPDGRLPNYAVTIYPGTLTVTNNAIPALGLLAAPLLPVPLGTSITVSAPFTDADVAASALYTTIIDWGNGTNTTNTSVPTPSVISGTKLYTLPGVYTITVTVKQNNFPTTHTDTKTFEYYVVVYDPNGGFVTGGGWINSPAGAYYANPTLTGKANFGFVAKYKKGQATPDGNTEFQYQTGNLNFKATSFEWLVLAGSRAQFKGSGTINGSGDFGFMLTAVDGTLKGNGSDTFRMKIWNKTTGATIYDNLLGASDATEPTTTLGGGSIQIHDK